MRDIGVIVSKKQPIQAELLSLAIETTSIARDRPFNSVAPQVWISSGSRVALLCWGYHPPLGLDAAAEIVVDGNHALIFSGSLYHPTYEHAEDVLQLLIKRNNSAQIFSELGGTGVVAYYDGTRGLTRLARTVAGAASMFFCDSDDLFIAGTRSLFTACVSQRTRLPEYDLDSLAAFVVVKAFNGEGTAFRGVRQAPVHSEISVNETGTMRIGSLSDDFEQYGLETREPSSSDFDQLTETLLNGARRLTPCGGKSRVGVSGGKDSRLLLAVLHRAGLDVSAYCGSNHADHPDLIAGQLLLKSAGIPYETPVILKATLGEDNIEQWETRVDSHLQTELLAYDARFTSRLARPFEGRPYLFPQHTSEAALTIEWTGTGGEMLKGGLAMPDFLGTFDPSLERMKNIIRGSVIGDISFLSPGLQDAAEQRWYEVWQEAYRSEVPLATLDRFYLNPFQARGGSFMARAAVICPYADSLLLRLNGRFSVRSKQENLLHVEAIRRLMPIMMDVPLAVQRWGFEMNGPVAGDEAGFEKRSPIPFPRTSAARNQIGYTNINIELKPVFMDSLRESERILGDRLDFKRLWEIATTPAALEHRYSSLFWALQTVHLLTSNRWLRDMEPERDPMRIVRLDLPWERIYFDLLTKYRTDRAALLDAFSGRDWELAAEAALGEGASTTSVFPRPEAFTASPPRILLDENVVVEVDHRLANNEIQVAAAVDGARTRTAWISVPLFDAGSVAGRTCEISVMAKSDLAQTHLCDVSYYERGGKRHILTDYNFTSGPEEATNRLSVTIPAMASEGGAVELLLALEPHVSRLSCRVAPPQWAPTAVAEFALRCRNLAAWFRDLLAAVAERHGADSQRIAKELDRIRALDPVWSEGPIPELKPGLSAERLLDFDADGAEELVALARTQRATEAADIASLILQPVHSLARYLALRIPTMSKRESN